MVSISFQNYVTFSNLSFQGANSYTFKLTNSNNITVNNCNINFTGIDAINALSSGYFTLSNSTISNTNNDGINMYWYCNNAVIQNNTVTNTAIIPGMGQNAGNAHQGMYVNGSYNLIQYCEVDNSGANGIHFDGDYSTIQNCYVNTFGVTVDDCGGIYTSNGDNVIFNNKSILDNIVVNGIGANAGTPDPTYIPVVGIYFDNNTNHVTALRNTVANCAQTGFFNHTATYSDIENNTFYNNGNEQFLAVRENNPLSNVVFKNNICFSKTASQLVSRLESQYGTNNLPQIGTFDNNYYCRPIDNNFMFYNMDEIGNSGQYNTYNQTLSTWQSSLGLDPNSQTSPATIPSFTASNLSGSNLFPNGSFSSNIYNVAKWSPIGDIITNWVPGELDGGTLQVSANNYSSSNSFYTTLSTDNSVTAGQGYQLSFTMMGAASGRPMTVYLKQQDPPNNAITQKIIVPIPANRQDFQFGFIPTMSGRVSIELDVAQPNGAVWIDNVMLQQASIWPTNPDDYIIFAYNPSTSNKQVGLPHGTKFYDATGKQYNNNTVLKPYTSIVLYKQFTAQGSSNAVAQQSISLAGNLVDATASSTINSAATKLNWKVDNQNSTASYYEVQRSSDAQNFTTVGKATVKTEGASVVYQYNDASPLAGKNYYRITQRNNKDSVGSTSKTVVVNNISFKVNPNPAKDVIHLSFDEIIN
ncbi:MAG: right-handed parallel beta-helix repeat-containing protein, partial [Bacteroidota bacterium]|nr:right-handed parallel beta-helix repeat-containing protein [Bacteroidota bacterium]